MENQKTRDVELGVAQLVAYALDRGLIGEEDVTYAANLMLDALHYEPTGAFVPRDAVAAVRGSELRPGLEEILAGLGMTAKQVAALKEKGVL